MIMIMIYTNHKCKSLKEAFLKKKKKKKVDLTMKKCEQLTFLGGTYFL